MEREGEGEATGGCEVDRASGGRSGASGPAPDDERLPGCAPGFTAHTLHDGSESVIEMGGGVATLRPATTQG